MKRSSIWLPAMAAGVALCAGEAALAEDTLSHVLGPDNLETLYATVMPDGTIKLSHEAPTEASTPERSAESTDAPAESAASTEEASTEQYPEI